MALTIIDPLIEEFSIGTVDLSIVFVNCDAFTSWPLVISAIESLSSLAKIIYYKIIHTISTFFLNLTNHNQLMQHKSSDFFLDSDSVSFHINHAILYKRIDQ